MNLNYNVLFYILFFISATGFCILLNIILLKFTKTLGVRHQQLEKIRWSKEVKPAIGGISFFFIFLLSISFHFFVFTNFISNPFDKELIGIVLACSIAFLMGLSDDAYDTAPWFKFFIQFLCGVILIYSNNFIHISDYNFINYSATLLWTIGIMNAINMLDNMDGTSGTVCLAIFSILLVINIYQNSLININNAILIGLISGITSFLLFNWYPSKIYMGDTGSQILGFITACMGINILWNSPLAQTQYTLSPFLLVALVFVFPLSDITIVSIKRIIKKSWPFIGGKDHTTHHLSFLGFSNTLVCIIVGLTTIIFGGVAIGFSMQLIAWNTTNIVLSISALIIVFVILNIISYKNQIDK